MTVGEREAYEAAKRTYKRPEWIVLPQVHISTGWNHYAGDRIIDLLCLNMYPSKGCKVIAIEVKESLSDWTSDVQNPAKQVLAHLYSDEFYYCVPDEMRPPRGWKMEHDGIMHVRDGFLCIDIKPRSRRQKIPYDHGFVAALIRRAWKEGQSDVREPK